jgi:pathogenesis-related protein 1
MTEEDKLMPRVMAGFGANKAQLTYKIEAALDRRKISDVVNGKENPNNGDKDKIVINPIEIEVNKKDFNRDKINDNNATSVISDVGVSSINKTQAIDALKVHNDERKSLGIPPLKWSPRLAQVAQNWANELVRKGCDLVHSHVSGYGENLFGGWGALYTAKDAALLWLDEKSEFSKYSWWPNAGHYSQMIWNTTTEVGMASGTCPDGSIVIVAEYTPAGNYTDESPY